MATLVHSIKSEVDEKNTCQYCHKNYSSKSNLKAHQQRTKKCIDMRTNSILMKELIISKEKNRLVADTIITDELSIPIPSTISPKNITQYLSHTPHPSDDCKDCSRVSSQLNSITALNNKMFIQIIDMCKQINNLSISLDNSTQKVMQQVTHNQNSTQVTQKIQC